MHGRHTATLALAGLLLGACSGTSSADECAEPTEAATSALNEMAAAHDRYQSVREEPVNPDDYDDDSTPSDDDGFYLSPESQARIAAGAQARGERRKHGRTYWNAAERYTIVVEQNGECFDTETQVQAEQLARRLEDMQ